MIIHKNPLLIFFIVSLHLSVSGCSTDGGQDDLDQWVQENSKGLEGKIPSLPTVKPYAPVAYEAASGIDPFSSRKLIVEVRKGGGGIAPDEDRPKEPLETFPLESIRYVGMIEKKKQPFAIVNVDGALYQVKVGNHMGQNFGEITKITETEISIRELVQEGIGGDWTEKASALQLQASGNTGK